LAADVTLGTRLAPNDEHGRDQDPKAASVIIVDGARQRAIAEFVEPYLHGTHRLAPRQLGSLTTAVAANRQLWEDLVVQDPDRR